jgi:hypothetical protein
VRSLYMISDYPGVTGDISTNEQGSGRFGVSMFQIRSRAFVRVLTNN